MMSRPQYGRHLVPYGYDTEEYLTAPPVSLAGYPDCQAISAAIVCNAPAGSQESDLMVEAVRCWSAATKHQNMIYQVEFLHHPGHGARLGVRGAVLFDMSGNPVFHFVNALLGYDGSGPTLSRNILRALLVQDERIDAINRAAKRPHVTIVYLDKSHCWQHRTHEEV